MSLPLRESPPCHMKTVGLQPPVLPFKASGVPSRVLQPLPQETASQGGEGTPTQSNPGSSVQLRLSDNLLHPVPETLENSSRHDSKLQMGGFR